MQAVGLTTEAAFTNYMRRTEGFSRTSAIKTIAYFILSIELLLLIQTLGLPYLVSSINDVKLAALDSAKRMYIVEASGFSRLNRFIKTQVTFYRSNLNSFNSSISIVQESSAFLGSKKTESQPISKQHIIVPFAKNQTEAAPIHIFSLPFVNFDKFKAVLHIDYEDGNPLNCRFSLISVDTAFTIVTITLRSILFLISVLLFFKFRKLRFTIQATSLGNWLIILIISCAMLSTNPFYFADFFVSKSFIKIIDSFFTQSFLALIYYVSFTHILFNDKIGETPSRFYVAITSFPFHILCLLFFATYTYVVIMIHDESMMASYSIFKWAFVLRKILFAILFVCQIVLHIVMYFKNSAMFSDPDFMVHSFLSIVFVAQMLYVQSKLSDEVSCFGMNSFITAYAVIYSLFFMFVNWPIEKDNVMETEDVMDNDDVAIGDLMDDAEADNSVVKLEDPVDQTDPVPRNDNPGQ
ncbi:hypothetical protein TVAG_107650 [Trichomonas vaginalis G3]|uniref:Uncharacterized protein n=1 Tax=Trichomonas vaginalis (strain ATCC PRA-98 / G3) TaxID=412133 RepID=A2F0R1_TRIV3|nr:transmembrane protein 181 family [Trichomonas vaginalis G3]EAY01506.1 hypothetical protein TVAG_107650 [Trichomonas vaginalis G3]KAI5482190.1 transmembrane protein 181 family [Trichomonas vaginalis G3]|eukprot:XP_001314191.1 hypothetical protein [Trichomonas vaginalis G3]